MKIHLEGAGNAVGKGGKGKGGAAGSFEALFQAVKGAGVLGGGKAPQECQVFLKNLPSDTTDADLYKLCPPFGAIPPNGVKAMLNPDGSCKGILDAFSRAPIFNKCVGFLYQITYFNGI
jgi:hypothetical protein